MYMVPSLPMVGDDSILFPVVYIHFVELVVGPLNCDCPVLLLSWWIFGCGDVAKLAAETAPESTIELIINENKNKITLLVEFLLFIWFIFNPPPEKLFILPFDSEYINITFIFY